MIITKHNLKFFNHAKNMSLMSDYHINSPPHNTKRSKAKFQVGCIAVYGNKILSTGFIEERKTPLSIFINQVDKIDAILKAKYYDEKYGMPEMYAEFYNHQLNKGVFTTGPLKEMFDSLKRKEE
jgi:hypothetical protein